MEPTPDSHLPSGHLARTGVLAAIAQTQENREAVIRGKTSSTNSTALLHKQLHTSAGKEGPVGQQLATAPCGSSFTYGGLMLSADAYQGRGMSRSQLKLSEDECAVVGACVQVTWSGSMPRARCA